MKHFKWLYGAIALAMLGACSDRDFLDDENATTNGTNADTTVAGYIAVEIKLPQETPTRAGEEEGEETPVVAEDTGAMNDQYGDGTAAEYKVHDALIALFIGTSEDDAVFYRAQDLQKPFFTNLPENDPVSASYIASIEVQRKPQSTETLYALVVLNRDKTANPITTDTDGKMSFKLGSATLTAGTKFSAVKEYLAQEAVKLYDETNNTRFFMTNAPMSNATGAGVTAGNITTLANLGNQIYDTPEQAKANVSGCIYVERAVAKVTYKNSDINNVLNLEFYDENGNKIDMTKAGYTVTASVKYAISNTPKNSYVVRNVDFSGDSHFSWTHAVNGRYRMVGTTPIPALSNPFHDSQKNFYRTYWCKVPRYGKTLTDKNTVTTSDQFKNTSTVFYCKENTFQVKDMNYTNSTLALFEVDVNVKKGTESVADNLFTRDGNNAKIYLNEMAAYADGITRIMKNPGFEAALTAAIKDGATLPKDFSVKDHLNIEWEFKKQDNSSSDVKYLFVKDIKLKVDLTKDGAYFDSGSAERFNTKLAPTKQTLMDGVNALSDVTVFEGGKSYYVAPIKHFGDYYTPWDKNTIKGTETYQVYNDGVTNWDDATSEHAEKYLGRYGVVRNNWYELNISKIAALGSSVIPDSNLDLSDDNNEDKKYFAVEIHLLSWAKRLQNLEF